MIDLHIHSRYSDDGEYTPEALVDMCAEQGIQVMSITDHNCVHANAEAQSLAKRKGMKYITGVEIDCVYEKTNFHVLGYGIDFLSNDFEQIEKNIEDQCLHASIGMLAKTQVLGFHITENDMWAISKERYRQGMWTGEMFAEVLLSKPEYNEHPLLKPYRLGGNRSDNPLVNFYWDYYAQGKQCYVKMRYPSMEKVIKVIHHNKGIAVLAHPGVNLQEKLHLLDGILALGMDGIETFSSYHTPAQMMYFYQKASEKRLVTTCGSDFHGNTKPFIHLGKHGCFISKEEMSHRLEIVFR